MLAIKLTTFTGGRLKPDSDHTTIQHRHCLCAGTVHNTQQCGGVPQRFWIFAYRCGRKRAAIVVNNNDVDIIAITQVSHEDVILTEIWYEGLKFYGAILYLPSVRDIEKDFETIEDILQLTKEDGIILAIDSNARSKLWFDRCTNTRGRALEEFIITRDLLIINEANDTPTFETNRGRSWIDLTIFNNILAQKTRGWTCGEEERCVDHKIIFFDIDSMEAGGTTTHHPGKRYFTKADNWGTFINIVAKNLLEKFDCRIYPNDLTTSDNALSQKVKLCSDTGQVIHKFTAAITAACDATLQVSRPGKRANKQRSVPWWTGELTLLRQNKNKNKKKTPARNEA